jgi:hypothetical protein
MKLSEACSYLLLLIGVLPIVSFHLRTPSRWLVRARDAERPPISCRNMRKVVRLHHRRNLVIGINKYSHDTAISVADADTRSILFALEKERVSRVKHDAGEVSYLVDYVLASINATMEEVSLIVQNNHHHRIRQFEENLPFAVAIKQYPDSYTSEENLFPKVEKLEVSHHLAHAWSAISTSASGSIDEREEDGDKTLVVVMDGMGESVSNMVVEEKDASGYIHDFPHRVSGDSLDDNSFQMFPTTFTHGGWRESESCYVISSKRYKNMLTPLFKRFVEERSPPELHNHGFENMESIGAVYSRVGVRERERVRHTQR